MPTDAKRALAQLARAAKSGAIDVPNAAQALKIPRRVAAAKLASLVRRGWVQRVRRGLYVLLPLEAEPDKPIASEDPWVLAREVFSPCYIGGWSAAEHWGLTEQLFRTTLVITSANIRSSSASLLGHEFLLHRVPLNRIVETTVWRGREKVRVSNRERTLIDCLRAPELCGGVRHLADMMREYELDAKANFAELVAEGRTAANGAAWKRLGYLAELLWREQSVVISEARRHLTTGNAKLDPGVRHKGSLITRWRLWANVPIGATPET